MNMRYFVVDAFADELFRGNPAGVCLLDEWLSDALLQSIAVENNLAETAFLIRREGFYDLRWFTPELEIDLCGHATLASAFVIFKFIEPEASSLAFETQSGRLVVARAGGLLEMDFPARMPEPIAVPELAEAALGVPVLEAHASRDLMLLVGSEQEVRELRPNLDLLGQIAGYLGVIVTAAGDAGGAEAAGGVGAGGDAGAAKGDTADFVSRFFVPGSAVPEDHVTGSTHCNLIPFWATRLGKDRLLAKQLSARGGTLYCQNCGDRVKIAGKSVLYLQGEILLEG